MAPEGLIPRIEGIIAPPVPVTIPPVLPLIATEVFMQLFISVLGTHLTYYISWIFRKQVFLKNLARKKSF